MQQLYNSTSPPAFAEEAFFLNCVRQLKAIGYGRMMQIITHEWLANENCPADDVLVTTALGLLPAAERARALQLYQSDPLFCNEPPTVIIARDDESSSL